MTYRDTVRIALFGALWGLVEITLGTTLKGLRIPLGGALLSALAVIIGLTGRAFTPVPGATVFMGAVAGLVKLFSIGTVIASPFVAILMESIILESIVLIMGINHFSCLIAGMTVVVYTILHPLLIQGMIFGADIYKLYIETFTRIATLLSIPPHRLIWVAVGYVVIHAILGLLAGWIGYRLPRRVKAELNRLRDKGRSSP
jgi:hypothetical protein